MSVGRAVGTAADIPFDPAPSDEYCGEWRWWDDRYASETEPFEWYHPYPTLRAAIRTYLPDLDARILVAGCGNSRMSEDLHGDGYEDVANADYSNVVVKQMREKYQDLAPSSDGLKPGLTWHHADLDDLTRKVGQHSEDDVDPAHAAVFADASFAAVLDKGTLDSVLCSRSGRGPRRYALRVLHEIDRILEDDGIYLCLSAAAPEWRLPLLENGDYDESSDCMAWKTDVVQIPKPTLDPYEVPDADNYDECYWLYVCQKFPALVEKKKAKLARDVKDEAAVLAGIEKGRVPKRRARPPPGGR